MSLKNREKQTILLTDKLAEKVARISNMLLVLMLFLQLILPVAIYADASEDDAMEPETEEVQSEDNIESPMTLMETDGDDTDGSETEETTPVTPEIPDEAEEAPPADDVVTEPVDEPEPEANSPPPAPVETPEAPEPAPEVKEPVVEEKAEVKATKEVMQIAPLSVGPTVFPTTPTFQATESYFYEGGDFVYDGSTNSHTQVRAFWTGTDGHFYMAFRVHNQHNPSVLSDITLGTQSAIAFETYASTQQVLSVQDGANPARTTRASYEGTSAGYHWVIADFGQITPSGTMTIKMDVRAGGHNLGTNGNFRVVISYQDIAVRKIWNGKIAETVKIVLKETTTNDPSYTKEVTLDGSETTAWQHVFLRVPMTRAVNNQTVSLKYEVSEVEIDGVNINQRNDYSVSIVGNEFTGFTVTNTYQVQNISLTAKKVWDGGPEANKQPVTLTLWQRTGTGTGTPTQVTNVSYTVNPATGPADEFTYTWTGLPTETSDGIPYTYYFTEEIVSGYTREYSNLVEFGEDKFGGFDLPGESPAYVKNTFEIRSEDKVAIKTWIGGENVRPPLWFQLWRTGLGGNEPVPNTTPLLLDAPVASYEAEVSVTFPDVELTDVNGNAYGFYVVEGTYNEATDTFTAGTPTNFVQEKGETDLHIINTYSIPTEGTASATKVWQGATSSDFLAVPLTLWRSTDGSIFEEVEVTPTIDPTIDGAVTYEYAWAGLEETDAQGNAYTFYFSEDIVPGGYERTYQGTTITGTNKETEETITVVESGGSVTNSELFIDFTFEKVNEVGLPLEGAVFELHRHGEGNARELVGRLGENPVTSTFTFEDLTKGTYTLTEVSAPDEYILPENNTWTFEVKWDDELERLVIEFVDDISFDDESGYEIANYPKGRLPETGGPGYGQTMMLSMFAFTLLVTLGAWRMKRDEVNQND